MNTASETTVHGHVANGWHRVADAFRANFDGNPGEAGAACAVYVGGRPVVDLWGGLADSEKKQAWNQDTITLVASTTKGATAVLCQRCQVRAERDPLAHTPESQQRVR